MVSAYHEALHRIFQKDPTLFARTFDRTLGVTFPPPREVSVLNADLTEIRPLERRVDTALLVKTGTGKHVIVVEAQSAPEETRRLSWPYYVAYLYNKHGCPVTLLVITGDPRTERWARQPIKVGLKEAPSQITQPLVAGPDNVPVITDVEHARQDVMLAVLSALAHRHSSRVNAILEALAAALDEMDRPTAKYLAEFTEFGLEKSPAGQIWRAMMKTMRFGFESELHREWRAEGREEGRQEGRQEGRELGRLQEAAAAVLRVLDARGLAVPEGLARRVNECTDLEVLEGLLIRAVTVERAEDLFAGPSAGSRA